jgi:hypothetical protein
LSHIAKEATHKQIPVSFENLEPENLGQILGTEQKNRPDWSNVIDGHRTIDMILTLYLRFWPSFRIRHGRPFFNVTL